MTNEFGIMFSYSLNFRRTLPLAVLLFVLLFTSPADSCFPGGRLIRRMPKKEPALVYKQHVPNVPEMSMMASGPREGRIKRTDRRFKELINNYNPDIIFKDEEHTGADRVMSLRCKEKLDALSMLVMNYWPGIRLRVIEAWDEDQFHAPDSLHYEGRAVDMTTSDRDKDKYGMLARLAAQAGFDWVFFESRGHVHASVKSDTVTRGKRTLRCFPESSTIITQSGVTKNMTSLRRGDTILTVSKKDNKFVYSRVISFLHVDRTTYGEYLRIYTENGTKLTISADHLMYKLMDAPSLTSSSYVKLLTSVFAKNLQIDDRIFVYNEKIDPNDFSCSEKIVTVESVIMKGLYAPLTEEGTIVVDGVAASCYAAVHSELLAHTLMAPLRFWYKMKNFLMEFVPNNYFYFTLSSNIDDDGVHGYANFLWWLADLMERLNLHSYLDHF